MKKKTLLLKRLLRGLLRACCHAHDFGAIANQTLGGFPIPISPTTLTAQPQPAILEKHLFVNNCLEKKGSRPLDMSSSQPFIPSSPLSPFAGSTARRKSKFTYKHLSQLGTSSASCPLRVIAHIDLDAFYAQCEMVRLNLPEDQPLAVQVSAGPPAIRGRVEPA